MSRLLDEHPQIMAVARTQHDAVFAERHRVRVAINGLVVNRRSGIVEQSS